MAFSFGLAEGTARDWSSVHVSDVARVAPATGALGLVAVSLFMVLIRLLGDRAVACFGRVNAVRVSALVAAAGYVVTILGRWLPVLLVGWALAGLGIGLIAPQVYAVAGHTGGARMLAVVVTFGCGAFLIGPADHRGTGRRDRHWPRHDTAFGSEPAPARVVAGALVRRVIGRGARAVRRLHGAAGRCLPHGRGRMVNGPRPAPSPCCQES